MPFIKDRIELDIKDNGSVVIDLQLDIIEVSKEDAENIIYHEKWEEVIDPYATGDTNYSEKVLMDVKIDWDAVDDLIEGYLEEDFDDYIE